MKNVFLMFLCLFSISSLASDMNIVKFNFLGKPAVVSCSDKKYFNNVLDFYPSGQPKSFQFNWQDNLQFRQHCTYSGFTGEFTDANFKIKLINQNEAPFQLNFLSSGKLSKIVSLVSIDFDQVQVEGPGGLDTARDADGVDVVSFWPNGTVKCIHSHFPLKLTETPHVGAYRQLSYSQDGQLLEALPCNNTNSSFCEEAPNYHACN